MASVVMLEACSMSAYSRVLAVFIKRLVRGSRPETAVERVLKLYSGLHSYFGSESCPQTQYLRLQAVFANPITEVYLLFYQEILPMLNHFNLLLQRDGP